MANVTWILGTDPINGKEWHIVLGAVFANGSILPGAIATQFHLHDGNNKATFQGNFDVSGGVVQSGMITGFDLYYGGTSAHLVDATGYQINFAAFKQALAAYQVTPSEALYDLFFSDRMTVHGSGQGEVVAGGHAADILYGKGGMDGITGAGGNDRIFGGDGNDGLDGGRGDDMLWGGSGLDKLNGGEGSDTAVLSAEANFIAVTLNGPNTVDLLIGGVVADRLVYVENVIGGSGNDQLIGDGFNNTFTGNAGDDKLIGNDGNDRLRGGDGRDKLDGGTGNDEIAGGKGNDLVIGGKNSDTLVFDTALNGKNNVDKVKKFSPGKDTIELDQSVFKALKPGVLKGKHLRLGEKAKDGNDHVLYDGDGELRYDADGKGGTKAVLFARLKGAPDIDADNLFVA